MILYGMEEAKREEQRCPDNICQQKVRNENIVWSLVGGKWGD